MLQQAEERDRAQRNQVSELRSEGLECAQMLRNAEQGVYGLQGEANVSELREEAQKMN